jgi:hypothetical protein
MPRYKLFLFLIGSLFFFASYVQAQSTQYIPPPQDSSKLKEIKPNQRDFVLELEGNFSVDNQRIRSATHLDQFKEMNEEKAQNAAELVEKTYHDWGYTLAKVQAIENPEGWTLHIDEGVLHSISIFGAGWYDTVLLRYQLLPYQVFHVPTLEQGLGRWLELHPDYSVRYELSDRLSTKEERAKKTTSIMKTLMKTQDHAVLKEQSQTSLFIYLERSEERAGLDFGFGYSSANKLELRTKLTKKSTFVENDWSKVDLLAGLARRSTIDPDSDDTYYYSNIDFNANWFSPKFTNQSWLRFSPGAGFSDLNEQRPDLPIDRYHVLETFGEAGLVGEWTKYQYVFLSGGYGLKHATGVDDVPSDPYTINNHTADGFRLRSGIDMIFSKPRDNRLLNDTFKVDLLWHARRSDGNLLEGTVKFHKVFFTQKIFYLFQTQAIWQENGIEYFDEIPINRLGISSSFSRKIWLRRGINVGCEGRYNLWGSQIQAALFSNITTFGNVDRATHQQSLAAAFDIGPAIYITLLDAFQFNVGFATGFSTIGLESYDVKIGFDKVF